MDEAAASARLAIALECSHDPGASLASRLARFDSEPWHLWDLREACLEWPSMPHCGPSAPSADELARAIRVLHAERARLVDILPAVVPSLGLLQQCDIRFQQRLSCAFAIPPSLLAERRAPSTYEGVMRACRPQWFS